MLYVAILEVLSLLLWSFPFIIVSGWDYHFVVAVSFASYVVDFILLLQFLISDIIAILLFLCMFLISDCVFFVFIICLTMLFSSKISLALYT